MRAIVHLILCGARADVGSQDLVVCPEQRAQVTICMDGFIRPVVRASISYLFRLSDERVVLGEEVFLTAGCLSSTIPFPAEVLKEGVRGRVEVYAVIIEPYGVFRVEDERSLGFVVSMAPNAETVPGSVASLLRGLRIECASLQ